ncbi:MAG: GTPase [Candidatus Brocadiia bacterium]
MASPDTDTFLRLTSAGSGGIAVVAILGVGAERFVAAHFSGGVPIVGKVRVGEISSDSEVIDTAVVVRRDKMAFEVCVHSSPAVLSELSRVLTGQGFAETSPSDPPAVYADEAFLGSAPTLRAAVLMSRATPSRWRVIAAEWLSLLKHGERGRVPLAVAKAAGLIPLSRLIEAPPLVVIAGAPNAGKSTLFNVLLGWKRTAVSPRPGTTHDAIEETTELRGFPVRLSDSPGLGWGGDFAQLLHREADRTMKNAGLVIELIDATSPASLRLNSPVSMIRAHNKIDAAPSGYVVPPAEIAVSALRGENIGALRERIADVLCIPDEKDDFADPIPFGCAATLVAGVFAATQSGDWPRIETLLAVFAGQGELK